MTRTLLQWILLLYLGGLITTEGHGSDLRVVHKLVGGHLTLNRDDDVELITSSAGEGKSSKKKTSNQEEKKTLAQQVADGKYGLIQSELFSKPIKKPGLISYRENGEVPRDTVSNLGGLNKSDIWLSENHLLVIKGGSYPPHSGQTLAADIWPSIDDYNAPNRQVKIPAHPKVPPPFPVQLTDNGPLLLLGTNASKTLNGTFQPSIYPLYPEENDVTSGEPPHYPHRNSTDASAGQTPFGVSPFPSPGLDYYDQAKERPVNVNLPYFPFVGPGDLPSIDNVTYDDDDPSVYYPPPYSFYYQQQNNSTEVPPGPLVPGIVLPPPPNFFAPLEEDHKKNATEALITTHKPTTFKTTTAKTIIQNTTIPKHEKPTYIPNNRKTYPPIIIETTTSTPQVNTQGRSFILHKLLPPSTKPKTIVTTTRVPLKTYYTSTHIQSNPQRNSNKQYIDEVIVNIPKVTTSKPPTQYYFYDENVINTTPRLHKPQYYIPAKEVNLYIKSQPPQEQNIGYYYVNNKPKQDFTNPDTFSIHIARLKDQIHTYQSALRNDEEYYERPIYKPPKPVYQYSFQSVDYQNQRNQFFRPVKNPPRHYSVEIQEAVEVTPPTPLYETTQGNNYYYAESTTENPNKKPISRTRSKPISEYSFEATPNPIFQQLYTKHDEQYIDDVTKQFFTTFGKKLPAATTPIPTYSRSNYLNSKPENLYRTGTISLDRDTIVNYLQPRPPTNPDIDYVDTVKYHQDRGNPDRYETFSNPTENLEENRRPYISYKLPGDEGTHFYFVTPKLTQKREQKASKFYS